MAEIAAHHGHLHDTQLHVEDTGGSGRPVVLIHGWPLTGESWRAQVSVLAAAGYRVVAYDRRGFGRSGKPLTGYGYDSLTADLRTVVQALGLTDATLIGFSMGGGEVARYLAVYGSDGIRSAVFASPVTPYLLHTPGNPDGPLSAALAAKMSASLTANEKHFYDGFLTDFFTAKGELTVTEDQRQEALAMALQSSKVAALQTLTAFGSTDFRDDLAKVTVPTLVVQGDSDLTVHFEGSGKRTHEAISGSELHVIEGAPHGCITSHATAWNEIVLRFLAR